MRNLFFSLFLSLALFPHLYAQDGINCPSTVQVDQVPTPGSPLRFKKMKGNCPVPPKGRAAFMDFQVDKYSCSAAVVLDSGRVQSVELKPIKDKKAAKFYELIVDQLGRPLKMVHMQDRFYFVWNDKEIKPTKGAAYLIHAEMTCDPDFKNMKFVYWKGNKPK